MIYKSWNDVNQETMSIKVINTIFGVVNIINYDRLLFIIVIIVIGAKRIITVVGYLLGLLSSLEARVIT